MEQILPRTKDYCFKSLNEIAVAQFDCGDSDLNIFFRVNAKDNEDELVSKTYFLTEVNKDIPLAAFCLSNAEIRTVADIELAISPQSQYGTYPAVRIGRFATHKDYRKKHLGTVTMDLIKTWFTNFNKTGCRFIVLDARKTEEAQKFYNYNGFEDYPKQENKNTVLKYFDLKAYSACLKNLK
ncbi:hypothetical protein NO2_0083 [Candidatus Termititenax persephonae]|uniref:N-acetyltransferase domain-containing protein n=1 Tax=Candidatus Termititenax persephonae TaxID=2218525 RepID=A0A388TF96_9BACT|nr:hypothetical protein NO2_0083 [Candidatus Termititenax persephonae]